MSIVRHFTSIKEQTNYLKENYDFCGYEPAIHFIESGFYRNYINEFYPVIETEDGRFVYGGVSIRYKKGDISLYLFEDIDSCGPLIHAFTGKELSLWELFGLPKPKIVWDKRLDNMPFNNL